MAAHSRAASISEVVGINEFVMSKYSPPPPELFHAFFDQVIAARYYAPSPHMHVQHQQQHSSSSSYASAAASSGLPMSAGASHSPTSYSYGAPPSPMLSAFPGAQGQASLAAPPATPLLSSVHTPSVPTPKMHRSTTLLQSAAAGGYSGSGESASSLMDVSSELDGAANGPTLSLRGPSSLGTMRFPLLFALLALSAVASAQDLPEHEKIVAPAYIPDTASILKGKYIVQFSRPPAASVTAQRREGVSAESLKVEVKAQQESFGVYCRRKQLNVKVNRRFANLLNAASVNIKNAEDLVKVANAPGVKAIFPVVQHTIPVEPQALKNPVIPQFAHNLTKINLVNERFPDLTGKDVKVGVIDSGIDWKHPAFAIPGQTCEEFKGPGCRVLYGSDFVGDLYDSNAKKDTPAATPQPDNDPLDCGGHGTHVAGIIGGFDDKVKGVAPEAIFGAYRVFGCDGKTDNAIILAALEQAYQDGMELVNLSLGGAHVGADSPYAQAIDTLVDNGVYVIAAASNDGVKGYSYVTAPSIASKAFSIASFDNTHALQTVAQVEGINGVGEIWFDYSPTDGVTQRFDQATKYKIIRSPNPPTFATDGCAPFPNNTFAGGVALVRRGGCEFTDKVVNAINAGAAQGVIVYNNVPGQLNGAVLNATRIGETPAGFISAEDGARIYAAATPASNITIQFNNEAKFRRSATSGQPSDFSSWGLDVNLRLRPDFGAPGGNIYSAYPLKKGGYAQLSGTSMASPYAAGIVALDVQRNGASQGADSALALARRFSNTARPSFPSNGDDSHAESVAKVGAGMIDALAFLENPVSVAPHKIELGDSPQWPRAPRKTQVLTIKNDGKEAKTYRFTHTPSRAVMGDNNRPAAQFATAKVHARVTFSTPSVTLQPGETKQVTVTFDSNVPLLGKLPEAGHWIYSGYVTLETADRKNQLNVPYAVMAGDYSTMPVLAAAPSPLAPSLTNAFVLNPLLAQFAPTYGNGNVPVFSLNATRLAEIPVIRLATLFPTRKLAISVHDATRADLPIVGYSLGLNHMSRIKSETGGTINIPFVGKVTPTPGGEDERLIADGTYVLGIQYVRPTALQSVPNPDAALYTGWTSPRFIVNRNRDQN
ncbi:hypothetical protein BCR44DRAFT_1516561 [Catenaria anguillulae PL171]|uniref:Peptidase S8/S53 domain-containing protein n=1 Tax=Catenaria anguillulae PL171 TaxID=765915 RepID=A0A1Y2H8W5_9FUNG|nr:hypothetical protein BCR44DRAFT_1516561 [Catenaria anguillulae PL171]